MTSKFHSNLRYTGSPLVFFAYTDNLFTRNVSFYSVKQRSADDSASLMSTFRTLPCPNSQSGPI